MSRRIARREYHKKIERKRRDRMRSLYDELRALTDAAELADKNGVLEGAITLIQQLREQNNELAEMLKAKAGEPARAPHTADTLPVCRKHLAALGSISPRQAADATSTTNSSASDSQHSAALSAAVTCPGDDRQECGSSSGSGCGGCPSESSARARV